MFCNHYVNTGLLHCFDFIQRVFFVSAYWVFMQKESTEFNHLWGSSDTSQSCRVSSSAEHTPLHPSIFPASASLVLFSILTLEDAVCHAVAYPLYKQLYLQGRVHYNESLVWFKESSFCYTINTGPFPWIFSDILPLPRVMEILWQWPRRTGPFTSSSSSWIGWVLGWVNSRPWLWAWVEAELVSLSLHQASSPFSKGAGLALPRLVARDRQGQFSCNPCHSFLLFNSLLPF